jgi:hypothetical protein
MACQGVELPAADSMLALFSCTQAIHQFLKSDARLPPLATESVAAEGAAAGPDGQVPHHVIRIRRGNAGGSGGGRGQRGGQVSFGVVSYCVVGCLVVKPTQKGSMVDSRRCT